MPNFTTKNHRLKPLRFNRVTYVDKVSGDLLRAIIPKAAVLDEIVIGDWIHVEVLDHRVIWVRLGDRTFIVYVPTDPSKPVELTEQDG